MEQLLDDEARGGQNRCFAPSLSIGLHTEQTPVCPGVDEAHTK
jgi:hypothetical protein